MEPRMVEMKINKTKENRMTKRTEEKRGCNMMVVPKVLRECNDN